MSKSRKVPEKVENMTEDVVVENQQAVNSTQSFAKNEIEEDILNETIIEEKEAPLKESIPAEEKSQLKKK